MTDEKLRLRFLVTGDWPTVSVQWVDSTHHAPRVVQSLIQRAWTDAISRLGDRLFDGPMCRLEQFDASDSHLHLHLSQTSYRIFLGTNLMHPELADRLGRSVLANPVGVSCALLSSDGFLLLGRRNDSVAYYPHRVHPFAGSLEPRADMNVFDEVRRELNEELAFTPSDIAAIRCCGIVEDMTIRHPELIFRVDSTRTRCEIESRLDATEHDATFAIPATRTGLLTVLHNVSNMTPVAVASLLLWGRSQWGQPWFEDACAMHGPDIGFEVVQHSI